MPLSPALALLRVGASGALAALALLAGCAADRRADRDEVDQISARHERDHSRLDAAKAEFAQHNPVPIVFECGDGGRIIVREAALEGFPGREELWIYYTWENTTDRPIDGVRVTLSVVDPVSRFRVDQEFDLTSPTLAPFGRESTYSSYVQVVAGDVGLSGRTLWEMRARAIRRIRGGGMLDR